MRRFIIATFVSLALFVFIFISSSSISAATYIYTPIDVPGANSTWAFGINDSCVIVGSYKDVEDVTHGFLYDGTNYTTIDFPNDTAYTTHIFDINDLDSFVGVVFSTNDGVKDGGRGFLYDGDFSIIDPIPMASHRAYGINDSGIIVGRYYLDGLDNGYMYDGNNPILIAPPSANWSEAWGINNFDDIVGTFDDLNGTHGFLYDGVIYKTIDVPGASYTRAFGINDANHIVGKYLGSDGNSHGFLYDGSVFTTIDFPGVLGTDLYKINNAGQIVGRYFDDNGGHGFIADIDSDGDGTADCNDGCPSDPNKTDAGVCGCGIADTDSDGDGIFDCNDTCNYNGICNPSENCVTCPEDCIGKATGKPSKRYCCGDEVCEGEENSTNCAVDCGSSPECGDGVCEGDENSCTCPDDCNSPPSYETICDDGIDNDCDGKVDCNDVIDCSGNPACDCKTKGELCGNNEECCSNNCRKNKCK